MLFKTVANVFEKIERISGRLEITQLLAELLQQATPQEASIITTISLGLLHPPYIGTQFNMAEKSVLKTLAFFLHVSEKEIQDHAKKEGDLGLVINHYAWESTHDLTVEQVYNALTQLEQLGGIGSQETKVHSLQTLLGQVDVQSAKYIIRIIIGKLRLGFSDMTLVDALSWMVTGNKSLRPIIEHAYNISADIGHIAFLLKQEGIEALKNKNIEMGIPIIPAAAERLPSARAIVEKLGHCVAQPKLDGFRLQIHLDKRGAEPKIHFYSRNLQDMSQMFPDLHRAVLQLPVQQLIAEGEAIAYDPNVGQFLHFQETVKRKRKHEIEQAMQEFPLKLFLFDILYLDGTSMLDHTHEQRRVFLTGIFNKITLPELAVIDEQPIATVQDLEIYFSHMIQQGLEGLVVKRPDAVYQPGKRNFNWIKLKRHQEGHLEDSIDAVILGYYAGEGKRASFGIGAFLVGVYNKSRDVFETIAKVGTGLTDIEWIDLKKECDKIKVTQQPHNVICAKELYPDVWVNPELVCIVLADEITLSPLHSAGKTVDQLGYALRFPRFMGYRPEKSGTESTTVAEIKRLYEDQFVK